MSVRAMAALAVLPLFTAGIGFPAAAGPGDLMGALTSGGLQRTYLVHAPAGVDRPTGLVINLHGAGMNGGEQAALTDYSAVADRFGFVVAYPDGIDASWADGRGASLPDREGVDDVGFLAALVNRLSSDYGPFLGRVYVTGMSAGGFMATRFACDRADLVSAAVPVAGTLSSSTSCNPSRPVSVLQIHGTADPVVPYSGGPMLGRGGPSDIVSAPAMAERWRQIDGCPSPLINDPAGGAVGRTVAAGCADGTEVVLVTIAGGGHTWPTSRFGIDASQASAEFFASH